MAIQVFRQDFTSTSVVVVAHNTNNLYVQVRLLIDDIVQNSLIESVVLDSSDPRNSVTVTLTGTYSGVVQLVTTDEAICTATEPPGSTMSMPTSATTNRSPQEKVQHSFTSSSDSDQHMILYDAILETTSGNGQMRAELVLDGSDVLATLASKPGGSGRQVKFSGHIEAAAYGVGAHTLAIQYKKIGGKGSVKVSSAKITSWRTI